MKKTIIVGILLVSLLLIGGCDYIDQICSQIDLPEELCRVITCVFGEVGLQNMANNLEVRNFLQTHPDAEITITLMPKSNVLKNMGTLSMELGTEPQVKDYIRLGLKDGRNTLTVLVDANTKELNYVKLGVLEQPAAIDPKQPTPPKEERSPKPPKEEKPVVIVQPVPFEKRRDKCWYGAWDKPIGYENRNKVWVDCKEETIELSDADLEQIDRLKAVCERGAISVCLVLKNKYGIIVG